MTSSTPQRPPAAPERVGPGPAQVAASALAAASASLAASFLGVAGTVVGAAVGAVIATVGSAIYAHSLRSASARLRLLRPVRANGELAPTAALAVPAPPMRRPSRAMWLSALAVVAAGVAIALGGITAAEALLGRTISGGGHGTTSLGSVVHDVTGSGSTPTPVTSPSPEPTDSPSAPVTGGPSATASPTAGASSAGAPTSGATGVPTSGATVAPTSGASSQPMPPTSVPQPTGVGPTP